VAEKVAVLVGAFPGATGADTALPFVKDHVAEAKVKVTDAGIIRRWANDKVEIKDTGDWGFVKGAVAGGAAVALLTALTGPIGITIAGAGVVTGLLARLHDSKVSDNALRKLGAGLKPDSSLLVIFVDPTGAAAATKALTDAGAVVTTEGMDADTINGLVAAYDAERAKK
jgi:uncharacterized membrane protein